MGIFIALLRGINVGGTGLLPMKDLTGLCSGLGFLAIRTYIQSGNVIFESRLSEQDIRSSLEKAVARRVGKNIDVMVRTPAEMRSILDNNPFPDKEPARVAVAFLCEPTPKKRQIGRELQGRRQVTGADLDLQYVMNGAPRHDEERRVQGTRRSLHL